MKALVRFWRRHFLESEAGTAVALSLVLLVCLVLFDSGRYMNEFMDGNRVNIYRTTATVAGTLFGVSIAAVSLVLNSVSSERFAVLREGRHYRSLWKTFFQTIRSLGGLTIMGLVCLAWDRDGAPVTWLVVPFVLLLSLSIFRLARVIWILEKIIEILSKPLPKVDGR